MDIEVFLKLLAPSSSTFTNYMVSEATLSLLQSWSWSATEEGCAENSAACRVAGLPANAGQPALNSEQNRPEEFTANSLHITLA